MLQKRIKIMATFGAKGFFSIQMSKEQAFNSIMESALKNEQVTDIREEVEEIVRAAVDEVYGSDPILIKAELDAVAAVMDGCKNDDRAAAACIKVLGKIQK